MNGMNGMSGIQLPFPFFPPFGCDTICQPIQLQIFQQQPQRKPFTIILIHYYMIADIYHQTFKTFKKIILTIKN